MTQHTFTTTIDGQDVVVIYEYHKGYAGDWIDPANGDMVEIIAVTPDVPASAYDDLAAEAFEDYAAYLSDAAEYRAEMRRDYDD